MRIAILGAGAWGTALAVSLGRAHTIALWSRNTGTCVHLHEQRSHPHALPGVRLPDAVEVCPLIDAAFDRAQLAIVATSVAGARDVLESIARMGFRQPVILACKGFERVTGRLPHVLARELLAAGNAVLSLSGPSFASEVAAGKPTALVLAGGRGSAARTTARLVQELHQPCLRLYSSTDPTGVEVAGALKNVIAIAAGMCDGMGLGLNARAALVTRGLAEVRRFGEALGARPETFLGLAGVGDLMLTCTAELSRNYRVGKGLAGGRPLAEILAGIGEVAEGVSTASAVARLAQDHAVEMPICTAVLAVLEGRHAPTEALHQLLARDPRAES
ncbi:MAG: NAD(P)-dependent glycerol-3-phosphate dehydrogenase [Pseudomonadota bacterium]|nr:NAD(P)-dependent glycerol-3-phosphate dehydrogenase [Pseudomonadota bacterium]